MKAMPVPLEAGRATCADIEHLPLVDAAHAKPGGPAAQEMKDRLCRHCPVNTVCHDWAMTHAEIGIWGGTSPNYRGRRGAPKSLPVVPRTLHTGAPEGVPAQPWRRTERDGRKAGARKPEATTLRLAELGTTAPDVKRWAYDRGLIRSVRGRVAMATIEAWAAARADQGA